MNVNPTAAVDDDEWQDKPVQLNHRTVATVGLVIVGALAIGLNLGLRQFSGQAQEPEARAEDNLYVQTDNAAVRRNDYNYLDATRPVEKVEPEAKPEPTTQVYRQPDPSAEARRREEEEARRSSLFPQGAQDLRQYAGIAASSSTANPLAGLDPGGLNLPSVEDLLPDAGPSATDRKQAFLASGAGGEGYLQHGLQKPLSAFEIKAGTVIPSALITGLNSDLPGEIIGQVTENVFDTASGQYLLIPQGSRIFGRYNADIDYGQDRAQIVWDRLIMPNGNSINLVAMIGTDKAGYAGLADQVDHHGGRLFGAVLLSSLITAGANLVSNSDDNGFTEDLSDAAAQQAVTIGSEIVRRQLDVQPTITIRAGFKLNILVNADILLEPYRE